VKPVNILWLFGRGNPLSLVQRNMEPTSRWATGWRRRIIPRGGGLKWPLGEGMGRTRKRANQSDVVVRRDNRKAALRIDGRLIDATPTQIAVLAALLNQKGKVVPYERLCRAVGHGVVRRREIHILRQYVRWAKQTLATHKTPYMIAVVKEAGYALCPMASH